MAYRMNTGNCYYEDGYLSNEYHGALHRGGFQNRYSGNFNYGQEDDEPSLKELMKSFMHAQSIADEALENQLKELSETIDREERDLSERMERDERDYHAWLQDMERKLDQMEERFLNAQTGQNNQGGNQNNRYQPPPMREEQINAITTRSGLKTGQNNEQETNIAGQTADAPHLSSDAPHPADRSNQCAAPQKVMRRTDPQHPENVIENNFEVLDDSEDEQEVNIEVETPKQAEKVVEHPELKAYKPRITYPQRLRKEKMKASYGSDIAYESEDDWFDELDELIMREDPEERVEAVDDVDGMIVEVLKEEDKSLDEELWELIGEFDGGGAELFDMDLNNLTCENLEEFLNVNHDPGPTEEMIGKVEDVNDKGMSTSIDKFNSLLMFREDRRDGNADHVASYLVKKKCKNRCKHIEDLRKLSILASTKQWNDALVKQFGKLYVSNEKCLFDDIMCTCD